MKTMQNIATHFTDVFKRVTKSHLQFVIQLDYLGGDKSEECVATMWNTSQKTKRLSLQGIKNNVQECLFCNILQFL